MVMRLSFEVYWHNLAGMSICKDNHLSWYEKTESAVLHDVSVYEKDGNTYAYGTLLLNGKKVSSMNIGNYKENITPDEIVASSLDYTFLKEDYAGLVEIDGISGKSKRGEILSKFGEPSRIETFDDGSGVLYYGMDSNDNTYIDFWYNEDSTINTISIVNEI